MSDLFALPALAPALVGALVVAVGASLGPRVIARLPEPLRESDAEGKVPYQELAARSGLAKGLAMVGVLVGGVVGWAVGWTPELAVWLVLGAVGIWLSYVDATLWLLPTTIIAPTYAVVIALIALAALATGTAGDWEQAGDDLLRAAICWAVMGGFYLGSWHYFPTQIAYGDVRLSGVLALALGYQGWVAFGAGFYLAFICGIFVGVVSRIVTRGRYFPFGPCMVAGAYLGLVVGHILAR